MNAFQTDDPYCSAPGGIRMALRKLNLRSPGIVKVERACKALKLAYKKPFWTDDYWAHFGIPKYKAVIVVGYTLSWINTLGFHQNWNGIGYRLLAITNKKVMSMPDDVLALHLKEALEQKEESK